MTPLTSLLGGAMFGLSATIVLLAHGRIAGISGICAETLRNVSGDRSFRLPFMLGLLSAGLVLHLVAPQFFDSAPVVSLPLILVAGLLVGFGTRLGSGCTSGHGVCGISRLSIRSFVATGVFVALGVVTCFVVQQVRGQGR